MGVRFRFLMGRSSSAGAETPMCWELVMFATAERRPLVIIPCFRWTRTSKPNGIAISLWVRKSSQAEMIALSMLLKAATGFASWIGGNGPLIHPSRVLFATSGLLPGCPDG